MKLDSNTVLITGGATGIGFALAENFLKCGNEVIICGRREDKLQFAKNVHPQMHIHHCDVSKESDRKLLFEWTSKYFPKTNVIINNAAIKNHIMIREEINLDKIKQEIAINFEAPIHLSSLFIPHLLKRDSPYIINISSRLAFSPLAIAPVYCALKSALHSYTMSLRLQLSNTPIKVVEIIPPSVDTDLGAPGLHTDGVPVKDFADAVMTGLAHGYPEITFGISEVLSRAPREELDNYFKLTNAPFLEVFK